jgi:hypothetical protein
MVQLRCGKSCSQSCVHAHFWGHKRGPRCRHVLWICRPNYVDGVRMSIIQIMPANIRDCYKYVQMYFFQMYFFQNKHACLQMYPHVKNDSMCHTHAQIRPLQVATHFQRVCDNPSMCVAQVSSQTAAHRRGVLGERGLADPCRQRRSVLLRHVSGAQSNA